MDPELKKRDREQKRRLEAAKKKWLEDLEAEPKIRVTIRNHDFINQGVPVEFTYKRIKKYSFKDGEVVELPISVVEHINKQGLVPDPVYVQDPETGQMTKQTDRKRARVTAVFDGSLSDLIKPKAPPKGKEATQ